MYTPFSVKNHLKGAAIDLLPDAIVVLALGNWDSCAKNIKINRTKSTVLTRTGTMFIQLIQSSSIRKTIKIKLSLKSANNIRLFSVWHQKSYHFVRISARKNGILSQHKNSKLIPKSMSICQPIWLPWGIGNKVVYLENKKMLYFSLYLVRRNLQYIL